MSDITFKYKGVVKGTMNDSGTATLETAGKYSEADYVIEYIRPSSSLQAKTATPTQSEQRITPDSGYVGLSSVTVNPIPSNYGLITYNGSKLTIS